LKQLDIVKKETGPKLKRCWLPMALMLTLKPWYWLRFILE